MLVKIGGCHHDLSFPLDISSSFFLFPFSMFGVKRIHQKKCLVLKELIGPIKSNNLVVCCNGILLYFFFLVIVSFSLEKDWRPFKNV